MATRRTKASREFSRVFERPDPWAGCPWVSAALAASRRTPSRAAALRHVRAFAEWYFDRCTIGSTRNIEELMRRLEASPTVAALLEFNLGDPDGRKPREVAEAVGWMLERLVEARARQLREAAPPGTDLFAKFSTADLRLATRRIEELPSRARDTLAHEFLVRRLNERLRKRPSRRERSPVHSLAAAVDGLLSAADANERDRVIVALAREVLGIETTTGKVHELRKRARSQPSHST